MILKTLFEKLFQMRESAGRMREQRVRPGADNGFDPYEKPFLDHLEDLRKTLGKMLGFLFVATILAFIFNVEIFEFVQMPAKLATLDDGSRLWDHIDFITLSPQEILMLSIKTAFFAALIFSFPILVWMGGEFIMPGLKQREKKLVIPGVTIGFFLFLTGACFAFFLASPVALKFFYGFYLDRVGVISAHATVRVEKLVPVQYLPGTEPKTANEANEPAKVGSENAAPAAPATADAAGPQLPPETKAAVREYLRNLLAVEEGSRLAIYFDPNRDKFIITSDTSKSVSYRIGEYINFITRLTLVFGISFQLPIVVTILVKLELLTARVMRNTRSYAWVIILVASAILTPPDVFTLGLMGGPLIILYEICIWIAWFIERKRDRLRREEEEKRQARRAYLSGKPAEELSEEEKKELHQPEMEQHEKEHAHLYEEESGHVPHEPGSGEGEVHGPYDPGHDEGWYDDPYGYDDPYQVEEEREPESGGADTGEKEVTEEKKDEEEKPAPEAGDQSAEIAEGKKPESGAEEDSTDAGEDLCEPLGPIVNLNTANLEEIESLPGISNQMANLLIDHRPYFTFDDVLHAPGMDEDLLNGIIDRLTLDEGAD